MMDLTGVVHERLLELLDYNPDTGVFTRKVSLSNCSPTGSVAGGDNGGYIYIMVGGKRYPAHQLAWFYVYKEWPPLLDHKDQNGFNNAIKNLRKADKSLNGANRGCNANNSTGFKGVTRHKKGYVSRIKIQNKQHYLGFFSDIHDAARAYDSAAIIHFGEFAVTNDTLGNYEGIK